MASLQDIFKLDVGFAYSDAGVPVQYGAFETKGIFIHEPLEVLQMNATHYAVQDTASTLSIVTGTLGELKNNTEIFIEGVSFQINKWISVGNGLETKLWVLRSN